MAKQLGNGMEKCMSCAGSGISPECVGPLSGKHHREETCPECKGSGEMPSGTDPLSFSSIQPDPVVPESQEVLREALGSEVRRLERLAEQ